MLAALLTLWWAWILAPCISDSCCIMADGLAEDFAALRAVSSSLTLERYDPGNSKTRSFGADAPAL